MTVYLFFGQEEYLMEKEIKKLKNELLDASFISMAYKIYDNPSFNNLLDCIQSPPLMFGNSLSLIYFDKYLMGNKLSLDDKQIESIDYSLSTLSDCINIIFICKIPRDENKKPDSRKKLFKTLSKYSIEKELNAQIAKMVKEKDLNISSDCISFLIEQLGSNLTLIDSELEKLKIALHPNKTILKESIKKYCTSSEDIFILADIIIQGNKNEILKQYNILTEKRHPLEIFSILQSNFQKFIFIKNYEKNMNTKDMALKLKLHEYIVIKTQEKLKGVSLDNLIKIRENLIEAEHKIKTGQALNSNIILELSLLS